MESKQRVFVNQSLIEMFGATAAEDLLERPIEESWVDRERFMEADRIMSAENNLVDFQVQRYRLDGSKWWVLMNSHFTEFDGKRSRVLWHVDITEMVDARAEAETAKNQLETRVQSRTAQLQATESRFRDYAEIASDWFWEMDSGLKYTFVSKAYEKISGKSRQALIGRTRREMYKGQFPEERDHWLNFLDTLDAHQDFDDFTFSYLREDGDQRTISTSGRAFFDESGTFKGYRGVGFDRTEQHQLQAQLRENQAQMLAFSENSTSPATIFDTQGRYILVNDVACDNFGLARDQVVGKTIFELYREEEAKSIEEQMHVVLETGKAQHFEFTTFHKQREMRTYLAERFPIFSENGEIESIGNVNTDITARKKIEEALRDSETRFQMIVDMQSELITRFSADWKLTFVNRAYCEFVNDTEENLIGTSMFADVPKDVTSRLIGYFEAFTPENAAQKNENQLQRHDGEIRDFEWSNLAEFDSDGKIVRYQSVGRDVTDQRKAQREIVLANEKAQEANRAKSNFLSTMSHEIRTPLNGVLGLAQLLIHSDLDVDQRKKIDTILSSGQTLLAIINDVLDMSKIEAGGLELEETAFSLRDLVSVIATPFQSLADDKGIKLRVSDSISSGLFLNGDPVRLRQILWNLLSNAIKFTDEGDVKLTIEEVGGGTADLEKTGDHYIVFTISDSGAGIAPERLEAIFDAFTQEDSSITRKFGGTGLGLSIVKQLTHMMGGTIRAKSELGTGSQFIVTLPFLQASAAEAEKLSLLASPQAIDVTAPLQILVAEDNPVNAMIARSFLENFGHQVRLAENGKIAVEIAAEDWADLILMDIHMPEMDGIEATRTIRETKRGSALPIVGLTAEAFSERHAHFREAGMDDVLTKPFTERQLADMLNKYGKPKPPEDSKPEIVGSVTPSISSDLATAEEAPPIGDDQRLDELREQMPPDVMASLLAQAGESLTNSMRDLRTAADQEDSPKIKQAAHSIKGSSGSMFAQRVSGLAAFIEDNCEDTTIVSQKIPLLEAAMEDTILWWRSKQDGSQ